jgi:hypothetical protein
LPLGSPVEVQCPYRANEPLNGIIAYLTRKYGGNVHDRGIVTITSKSVYSSDPGFAVRNVADLDSPSYFLSNGEESQWIVWNFHGLRIDRTHITIRRQRDSSCTGNSLIYFSNPGSSSISYDYPARVDSKELLASPDHTVTCRCSGSVCSCVKLYHRGSGRWGPVSFDLCAFEVFGTFIEVSK